MKIKTFIPTILIGLSSLTSCAPKVQKQVETFLTDPKLHTIMADTFSTKFSDELKVVEFNKLLKKYNKICDNYIVVDKKNCLTKVYSPDGDVLYSAEVALGRDIGDKRIGGYGVPNAKVRAYTTPGEFVIRNEGTSNKKDIKLYGDRLLILSGDFIVDEYKGTSVLALHRVPTSPMGKLRENILKNKSIKDNRVSFGCVNFLVEQYDSLRSFIKGKGTKVYILPEEVGNSLHLEKQANGDYKFFQTKYRTEAMENNK